MGIATGVVTLAGSAILALVAFLAVGLGVLINGVAEQAGWNVNLNLGPVGSIGGVLAVVGVLVAVLAVGVALDHWRRRRHYAPARPRDYTIT